ncbi:hypothetical protein [Microbacterium sufflavum]|uniref:TFIIB-type domain-containing protein n=1 Tax=Microbacterium sufflavum TaxID=2851649 RepID=A0ABY4IBP7_9MICO|nr:hypothetical protein [Microbacterium sufflavum]UPL09969.1 hypothetical protein KV394_02090 [Microbacterium sufflavum]
MQTARNDGGPQLGFGGQNALASTYSKRMTRTGQDGGDVTKFSYSAAIRSSLVELLAGIVMIVAGVALQVNGATGDEPDAGLTICGGVLLAFGGVLLSWMASRILAEHQLFQHESDTRRDAESALKTAQAEVDEKLGNLSRVLGQAAGQIAQAVEKVDSGLISNDTGFELISQSNRMIYGQVGEIAVIRKSKFDPAYLLDTASTLDDLARDLSARTQTGTTDQDSLATVRQKIETVRVGLEGAGATNVRAVSETQVTCPYCDATQRAMLGVNPGDTASVTCALCGEGFNAHRNAAGDSFTRRRGATAVPDAVTPTSTRWSTKCESCGYVLSISKNGKGERTVICANCFSANEIDPDAPSSKLASEPWRKEDAQDVFRSGSRPKSLCPDCGARVNMPLRWQDGYFGFCSQDKVVLLTTDDVWGALLLAES